MRKKTQKTGRQFETGGKLKYPKTYVALPLYNKYVDYKLLYITIGKGLWPWSTDIQTDEMTSAQVKTNTVIFFMRQVNIDGNGKKCMGR